MELELRHKFENGGNTMNSNIEVDYNGGISSSSSPTSNPAVFTTKLHSDGYGSDDSLNEDNIHHNKSNFEIERAITYQPTAMDSVCEMEAKVKTASDPNSLINARGMSIEFNAAKLSLFVVNEVIEVDSLGGVVNRTGEEKHTIGRQSNSILDSCNNSPDVSKEKVTNQQKEEEEQPIGKVNTTAAVKVVQKEEQKGAKTGGAWGKLKDKSKLGRGGGSKSSINYKMKKLLAKARMLKNLANEARMYNQRVQQSLEIANSGNPGSGGGGAGAGVSGLDEIDEFRAKYSFLLNLSKDDLGLRGSLTGQERNMCLPVTSDGSGMNNMSGGGSSSRKSIGGGASAAGATSMSLGGVFSTKGGGGESTNMTSSDMFKQAQSDFLQAKIEALTIVRNLNPLDRVDGLDSIQESFWKGYRLPLNSSETKLLRVDKGYHLEPGSEQHRLMVMNAQNAGVPLSQALKGCT